MLIRWGIIGLGDIAERNLTPALAKAAGSQLVSVYSRSLDKGKAFCAKYHVPRAYDTLDQMLADRELDAVYIASPNALHAEQSVAASRAGKHVLCDKPMALTEADGERMILAADEHKVRLDVAYRLRYHPAHIEARRCVQSGVLGEMQLIKAQNFVGGVRPYWASMGWRNDPSIAGSGSIVAQAVHPVDLLRYLTDSEIIEVRCITDEAPPSRPTDETTVSIFKFANGALAQVAPARWCRARTTTRCYTAAGARFRVSARWAATRPGACKRWWWTATRRRCARRLRMTRPSRAPRA